MTMERANRPGHAGYAVSQRRRKLVEEPFRWMKTVGGLGKLRCCARVQTMKNGSKSQRQMIVSPAGEG